MSTFVVRLQKHIEFTHNYFLSHLKIAADDKKLMSIVIMILSVFYIQRSLVNRKSNLLHALNAKYLKMRILL